MDASSNFLYAHPVGSLSPSLWDDDDWWEKPDVFSNKDVIVKDDVALGSPSSPFSTSSLDQSIFPNDDALNWMEKRCDLESLTELEHVSVQDVDQIPIEDLRQVETSFKQMENIKYAEDKVKEESPSSGTLFNVDGLEDLFHDYIDPEVYKMKDERRVSTDSGFSCEDFEDNLYAAESKVDEVVGTIQSSAKKDNNCYTSTPEHVPVQSSFKSVIAPQSQYRQIFPKPLKEDVKLNKVISTPVSTSPKQTIKIIPAGQPSMVIQPFYVNAEPLNFKIDSNGISMLETKVHSHLPAAEKINSVDLKPRAKLSPISKSEIPKTISIQKFLGSLKRVENLAPLNALLQESNNLINSSERFTSISESPTLKEPEIIITCDPDVSDTMGSHLGVINSIEDSPSMMEVSPAYEGTYLAGIPDKKEPIVLSSPQTQDICIDENPSARDYSFDEGPTYTVSLQDSSSCSSTSDDNSPLPIISFDDSLSPGPSYSQLDQDWSPMKKTVRNRRKIVTTEERKSRKKVQNKEAAIRYRQKKRDEYSEFLQEENQLLEKNKQLQDKYGAITTEIKYLKGLLRDLYKAKGLIK